MSQLRHYRRPYFACRISTMPIKSIEQPDSAGSRRLIALLLINSSVGIAWILSQPSAVRPYQWPLSGLLPARKCYDRRPLPIPRRFSPGGRGERAMKNLTWMAALVLLTGVLTCPARAQDFNKTNPVKPAVSRSQAVLAQWNDIGRKLIAMAEDFPEDKYDFKPTPAQRTFAEQLLHATGVNYYFTNVVLGEKPPDSENPPRTATRPRRM